jgi:uncharacterized protein YpuA (DUF1002 family)
MGTTLRLRKIAEHRGRQALEAVVALSERAERTGRDKVKLAVIVDECDKVLANAKR